MEPPSQGGKCEQSPQNLMRFPSPAIPSSGIAPENTPAASLPDTRLSYCSITSAPEGAQGPQHVHVAETAWLF